MNQVEFEATRQQINFICWALQDLDLDGFIQAIGRAEALGPIQDPSAYLDAAQQMDDLRKVAEDLLEVQCTLKEIGGVNNQGN